MITPKQIEKKTMTPEKRKIDKNNLFGYWICRPISYILTMPFLRLGVKANTVSLISIFASIAGFLLLGFSASKNMQIIGVLLFILWAELDCVDGNIARYTGQASAYGMLWDATAGYLALSLMHFAMGLSVMHEPNRILPMIIPDYWYIAFGGLISLSALFTRLVMHKKMLLFSKNEGITFTDKSNYSLPQIIALNLTSPSGFTTIFMLFAVVADGAREFILIYFLMHVIITIISMKRLMSK